MMKYKILFIVSLMALFFSGCVTDTPTVDTPPITPVVEIDSTEIKRIAAEKAAAEAALIAAAEEEAKKEEARLAKIKRDSIRKVKKQLAAKKKKEAERKAAAKAKAEAQKAATAVATSQPTAKPKPAPKPKGGPKIAFEKKVHEFGTIKEGDVIKHQFFFKNTGNEDLLIMDATATCGCTAPGFSFFPLKPGDESAITVTYNSAHKAGPQRPEITVITNAYPKKHILRLEGIVE